MGNGPTGNYRDGSSDYDRDGSPSGAPPGHAASPSAACCSACSACSACAACAAASRATCGTHRHGDSACGAAEDSHGSADAADNAPGYGDTDDVPASHCHDNAGANCHEGNL